MLGRRSLPKQAKGPYNIRMTFRTASRVALTRVLPIAGWLCTYRRADLRGDLFAGLTAGAMLVPQGMVYAQLAGLPPEVGLYAATVPLLAYAVFGTSRQLSVGPVAVISLLTATALAPLAAGEAAAYAAAAAVLALLVGVISIVLGLARMGWVTNLLSHSVLVGFTAASAVIIAAGQLKHIVGVRLPRVEGFIETVDALAREIASTDPLTAVIGLASLIVLVSLKRWRRTFPSALAVAIIAIVISKLFDLADHGVAVVGKVPGGLPPLRLPDLSGGLIGDLAAPAFTIAVIGYVESVAVAKVYARKNRYEIDPNQELIALGAANVTAAVFSGQPVTGGFSRTAVNADAGARTALASIVTAGFIGVVLLFLTGWFTQLPQAVLGAIVITAVVGLIDTAEMRHIALVKRSDAVSVMIAFVATIVFGVELGIAIAVSAGLIMLIIRVMNPHSAELGRVPGSDTYRNLERFPEGEPTVGVAVLRIDVSLNFANVSFLKRRMRQLCDTHPEGLRDIVIDGSGINDLDASAEAALADLVDEFDDLGITLHLAGMKGPVRDVLIRSGLWARLGTRVHPSVHLALTAITGEAHPEHRFVGLDERTIMPG